MQDNAADRPKMSAVVAMFENDNASLPCPKEPAFIIIKEAIQGDDQTGSSSQGIASINEVTLTTLQGR